MTFLEGFVSTSEMVNICVREHLQYRKWPLPGFDSNQIVETGRNILPRSYKPGVHLQGTHNI